jgi:hypothetical protein
MKTVLSLLVVCCAILSSSWARAGLTFEKTLLSYTANHSDTQVSADFKFKVTGGKTIKISDVATYCSCLKAKTKDGKTEYKDGEEGVIETAFQLGTFDGEVTKQVVVVSDDAEQKEITLAVKVTIPPLYKIEPEHLIWTVGDEAKGKTMKFTILGDKDIEVTGLVSSRESMVGELKEIKKGREYLITLTPKSTAEPMLGVLRVETNAPFPRYQKRLLFFSITKQKVDPVQKQ